MRPSVRPKRWHDTALKPLVWLLCLLPAAWLLWLLAQGGLGANPVEALIRASGDWTLRLLCVVLLLTPLQKVANWTALARIRRLLGLFVFFYALLHATIYVGLDMGWVWSDVWGDVWQRPFILVGFLGLLFLATLAITSLQVAIRALGGRRWKRLHQGIHLIAWLALLHFYWMRTGKNDVVEVAWYALIVVILQGWRIERAWRRYKIRRTSL